MRQRGFQEVAHQVRRIAVPRDIHERNGHGARHDRSRYGAATRAHDITSYVETASIKRSRR